MDESKISLGITGSFGYIGKRLIARLAKSDAFARVICTDILLPPGILPEPFEYHPCDIRDRKKLTDIFQRTGVDTLIHLAFIAQPTRNPDFEYDVDVNGTSNVLHVCEHLGVKKLIVASSDCAYGFFDGTQDFLPETAPIRATPGFPYSENKAEVETRLSVFAKNHPDISVVILRPCMVMGPTTDNTTSRSMQQPVIIGVRGSDPIMQFIHEDDAAEAFYLAAVRPVAGAFNLAADEGMRYSELARLLGKPMLFLPVWLIYPLVESLYRLKLLPFGKAQLDYIRYPLSMDIRKIQAEFGFRPRYTSKETVRSFINKRNG